ncbi:MAG: hypothetical protein A2041_07695 [Bacteroidetes bacterium GWA2_31_9b]|nr:MAG: hypothetical protein A2041_07695 [Bacteroidetes bacterium GWA2_31_9b]
MLSICIPIYNFYVDELVNELHSQALLLKIDFEIILIDDFSETLFKNQNKCLVELPNVKYIELPENIGRSKIRNLFLKHAQFNYLLFLDCDAYIDSKSYLKKYIKSIKPETNVLCGGLSYNLKKTEKKYRLRWKYGLKKEVLSLNYRLENPYKSFNTIHFLIKRAILQNIPFEERIAGYGHEDTFFGYQLKMNKIAITHIDNPVINDSLESNEEFITKSEQAIQNLIHIKNILSHNPDFEKDITLLNTYSKLKKLRIIFLVNYFWIVTHSLIRKSLILGCTNINLFSFYKLGYFIRKQHFSQI